MYDYPREYNKPIESKVDSTLGYLYFMDRNHPLASNIGRVWMHRHIMSVEIGRWLSKTEVVHHNNGDKSDNSIDNLTMFRDVSEHSKHHQNDVPPIVCKQCHVIFQPDQNGGRMYCSTKCSHKSTRRTVVTKKELQKLVWEKPLEDIGKQFGVSGRAVGKWCQKWNVQKPPRGYWIKKHL